jgi:ribonuclease J
MKLAKICTLGKLIFVLSLSKSDGTVVSGPDIISRGFVYVKESEELMEEVHRIASTTITQLVNKSGK